MSAETALQPDFDVVLDNRAWLRRTKPFPHILACSVFSPAVYERLEAAYKESLNAVLGRAYLENHDIHGTTLGPSDVDRFHPLLSRAWNDLIASVVGVAVTGHVLCGLHHHLVGSQDGFPHNDLNSGWFAGEPAGGSIELSAPHVVDYTTGKALAEGAEPLETVRAIAVIFYLANAPWSAGDGGVTGLYRRATDVPHQPLLQVPPSNNTLLAFECTPLSYHGFISNRAHPRNSIIMWLHRSKADATTQWGDRAIVPYGLRPQARPKR